MKRIWMLECEMRIHLRGNKVMEWVGGGAGDRGGRTFITFIREQRDATCSPCCQNSNENGATLASSFVEFDD